MINNYQAPLVTTPHLKCNENNFTIKSIRDKAQGNWPMIFERLGINAFFLKDKHGPCPVCGGKDRFRFDNIEQRGTFYCNNCGAGDGVKLIQLYLNCDSLSAAKQVAYILGIQFEANYVSGPKPIKHFIEQTNIKPNEETLIRRRKNLNLIWAQGKNIKIGDSADCYLKARGIKLEISLAALRLHPNLPYYDSRVLIGKFPAMLALVQNHNSKAVALHRTYLGNGCKANVPTPRKIIPSKPNVLSGAAIRLFDPADGKLAIAEGVETALAFYCATQIPVWSTISAWGMENIILPEDIRNIVIAADNDASGRGQEAAHKLKTRLIAEGRKIKIVMPPKTNQDFNDLLLEVGL